MLLLSVVYPVVNEANIDACYIYGFYTVIDPFNDYAIFVYYFAFCLLYAGIKVTIRAAGELEFIKLSDKSH
jgi:hypothetical protein